MQDARLVKFLRQAAGEAMPVVADPGVISPAAFLEDVLTNRFPNPFIPDAPARIATDSSQKIPVRFGVTLQARKAAGLPNDTLEAIPLFIALWLRYRMGKDDVGNTMTLSPDPRVPQAIAALEGLPFGTAVDLWPVLSDAVQFGIDLYEAGLGTVIEGLFAELSAGAGAVSRMLTQKFN